MVDTPGFAQAFKPALEMKAIGGMGALLWRFLIPYMCLRWRKKNNRSLSFSLKRCLLVHKSSARRLHCLCTHEEYKPQSLHVCMLMQRSVRAVNLAPAPLQFHHSQCVHVCMFFWFFVSLISAALLFHSDGFSPAAVCSCHLILV